jgi:hypothetical protein
MTNGNQNFTSTIKYILCSFAALFIVFNMASCGGGTDYVEETLEDPTQGIIVRLEEEVKDKFLITDEEIIEKREDSQIIVSFLDGKIDTFSIEEVTITRANDPRSSTFRTIAMAGMLGYYMGRPMSSGVSRGAYASNDAYNKSQSTTSSLRSTATRRTVRRPSTTSGSSSGSRYGTGRSTRSYGG